MKGLILLQGIGTQPLVLATVLIAFVDGVNPCSLWVLTLLLGIVVHAGSRRKAVVVGVIFLAVTAGGYGFAYWVNDNCVQCGTCERICPMQNITDSQTKPRWHHNCINCAACYHHCTSKAICLDKEDPSFRYNHPDVTAEDLIKLAERVNC